MLHPKMDMKKIISEVEWRDDKIKMFGKIYAQSRLVAWHGDVGVVYKYSNIKMVSHGWTNSLSLIKVHLLATLGIDFNSVLVNYYRDGDDHMSYHQDNEKELGFNPTIVSLSMGEERDFHFKHIKTNEVVLMKLRHGDCLIMSGETQTYWKHAIPKRKKIFTPRLNLTFRNII